MPTLYEWSRRLAEPVLPLLHATVRHDLARLLARLGDEESNGRTRRRPALLDVGGRRSPYTVALPCDVTVLDLPRDGEVQASLDLGLTERLLAQLRARRSNIVDVRLEDMTRTALPSQSFDAAVSVEVIEHVPDDAAFVAQIARILKPGGFAYLTTPNGDYRRNVPPHENPDHLRHYTRDALAALLREHFALVEVRYGIQMGRNWYTGLRSMSATRPVQTLRTMTANLRNRRESRDKAEVAHRTAHLFAIAHKPHA